MKTRILLLILLGFSISSAHAAQYTTIDLNRVYINELPVYLASPTQTPVILGTPEHSSAYSNPQYSWSYPNYWSPYAIGWGPSWGMPYGYWGPSTNVYYSTPGYVYQYDGLLLNFGQNDQGNLIYLIGAKIFGDKYSLIYGPYKITVGQSVSVLQKPFPESYDTAMNRNVRRTIVQSKSFSVILKCEGGMGANTESARLKFVIGMDNIIQSIEMSFE